MIYKDPNDPEWLKIYKEESITCCNVFTYGTKPLIEAIQQYRNAIIRIYTCPITNCDKCRSLIFNILDFNPLEVDSQL